MKINKKIEKELLFKNNIKDITSISLDSEYKVDESNISGNFIISGDYKIHEVSINKEKFEFKLPFKEELDEDVDFNSVKLEITNFEYDYRKDELLVNIEYEIIGDRKDVLIFDNEESLDEFLNSREIEVIDTRLEDIKEDVDIEVKEDIIEEVKEGIKEEVKTVKEEKEEIEERKEYKYEKIETDKIINSIDKPKDNFVTYKIYKIQENDTLEGIVLKYKTTLDDLKEYNELNNLQINDKLIIPYYE